MNHVHLNLSVAALARLRHWGAGGRLLILILGNCNRSAQGH
jgi:hypothetical protein